MSVAILDRQRLGLNLSLSLRVAGAGLDVAPPPSPKLDRMRDLTRQRARGVSLIPDNRRKRILIERFRCQRL
jgi:hypothetical protein